ncbi:MAG: VanZ family protein [Candidatus Marinimicrobia bacterium]|nr:VanZ family protein [Candidatus Neomarinimicrobiota bacterium]MBL7046238.1 VanZ family protein [Candidatus Neomarinimicrobiota bacterium]
MNFVRYRRITACYCVLILLFSSIPGKSIPETRLFSYDKLLHIFEYAILGWLLAGSLEQRNLKFIIGILLFGMVFGGFDELWQSVTPDRNMSVYDWLSDCIGLILGFFIYLLRLKIIFPSGKVRYG